MSLTVNQTPHPTWVRDLKPYVPGKPIEELERELGISGAVKLASNENPLGPSPLAVEAMAKTLSQGHLYPDANSFYLKAKLFVDLLRFRVWGLAAPGVLSLLVA